MFQKSDTKEIKRALQKHFNYPFSVRRDRGTASHWINVTWVDGPTQHDVRQFCSKFNDTARDDIMTDLWCGSQYTTENREISAKAYIWAVRKIEKEYGVNLKVTIQESWKGNGEKTAYIATQDDIIIENDNPDYSQRYASNTVNRKIYNTDFRFVQYDHTGRNTTRIEQQQEKPVSPVLAKILSD